MSVELECRSILCTAVDRRYVELAGVMLASAVRNGELKGVRLLVVGDGLKASDKDKLRRCVPGRHLEFIDLDAGSIRKIAGLRTNSNWSRIIYARLLLPSLVDESVERILYLDADIVVTDSLRPLINIDMNGMPVAAVGDASSDRHTSRLNILTGTYFNSGVLLFDVARWNDEALTQVCINISREQSVRLRYFDQDALNIGAYGKIHRLDRYWNATSKDGSKGDAAIVHFTHKKPNFKDCVHPDRHIFLELRKATPWADKRLKGPVDRFINRLKHSLKKRLKWRTA